MASGWTYSTGPWSSAASGAAETASAKSWPSTTTTVSTGLVKVVSARSTAVAYRSAPAARVTWPVVGVVNALSWLKTPAEMAAVPPRTTILVGARRVSWVLMAAGMAVGWTRRRGAPCQPAMAAAVAASANWAPEAHVHDRLVRGVLGGGRGRGAVAVRSGQARIGDVPRRVGRVGGWDGQAVGGTAPVRPGDEPVLRPRQRLEWRRHEVDAGAFDEGRLDGRRPARVAPRHGETGGVGLERQDVALGVQVDGRRVLQAVVVGRREGDLEQRRVVMLGRREVARGHPAERLQVVGMASRLRTVVDAHVPAQIGRRQRALLEVAGASLEADVLPDRVERRDARRPDRGRVAAAVQGGLGRRRGAVDERDGRARGRVAGRDGVRAARVADAIGVRHPQTDLVGPVGVDMGRRRRGAVAERAVAVEVPAVAQRRGRRLGSRCRRSGRSAARRRA